MMLALILLFLFVRDPDSLLYKETHGILIRNSLANRWARLSQQQFTEEYSALVDENSNTESTVKQRTSLTAFLDLPSQQQKSLAALLIAIFAWFMGNNAIETFFTLFATNTYGISGGQATMMLAGFSLAFLLFAVPAGRIGHKFGRKRTILIGLIGFIIIFVLIIAKPSQMLLQFLLIIAGFFWAFININSLPMVLEFATLSSIGTFTGYYYMFSFSASIVSPIFYGFLQDIFQNDALLFVFALVCFIVAFSSFLFVKHGEEHL